LVPSQNFLLARNSIAAAVHGALELSTAAVILPSEVLMVIVLVPVFGALAGGVPTSTILPCPVSGVQVQATVPAFGPDEAEGLSSSRSVDTSQTAAPAITPPARADPIPIWR